MNDIIIIALVFIICVTIVALMIIWSTIASKEDMLKLKSNTNIKTELSKTEIEAELSVDIEGKKAKEKDGQVS